jgi:hypothetical protein
VKKYGATHAAHAGVLNLQFISESLVRSLHEFDDYYTNSYGEVKKELEWMGDFLVFLKIK